MAKALLDWDKVRLAIIERHAELEARGITKFSIRNLHYYFKQVRNDLGVGRPKNPYKELGSHITQWKKKYPESGINPDWFYDSSRPDASWAPEQTPEEYADYLARGIKDALNDYPTYRWFKQPIYVETWVEKDAMTPIIKQMVDNNGLAVKTVTCKGYIGDTKLREHVKRLYMWQSWYGKKIVIVDTGDLDPSGEDMSEILKARIKEIEPRMIVDDPEKFEIKRIAVLDEHIEKFHLTKLGPEDDAKDDEETKKLKEKLRNDPRAKKFREKRKSEQHPDGELFCVELDAMASEEAFDELEKIIVNAVEDSFDEDIYNKYADKYFTKEQVGKWLIKKLDTTLDEVREEWLGDGEDPLEAPSDNAELVAAAATAATATTKKNKSNKKKRIRSRTDMAAAAAGVATGV